MKDMVKAAAALARIAHAGQTRMDGVEPYINHPRRVAERLKMCDDFQKQIEILVAVAWLHDVVEDTEVTFQDLEVLGFPPSVVQMVDVLTRRKSEGETHDEYMDRVAWHPAAAHIKIADMEDNQASLPKGHPLASRYVAGLKFLRGLPMPEA